MVTMGGSDPFDLQTGWDYAAEAWRDFVRSGADYYRLHVHGPALLSACDPVAGRNVLDLGCGEGYYSRELARAGADVIGIDVSPGQISYAREEEAAHPLGVTYEAIDARRLEERWSQPSFDMVTGCMSVQDMPDADRITQQVARLLRRPGRFVFSVPHPATDTPVREWERDESGRKIALKIDRYFGTGPSVMQWTMPRLKYQWSTPHFRRTLEEWSTLLGNAGLRIRRLLEPRPSADAVEKYPDLVPRPEMVAATEVLAPGLACS